MRLKKTLLLGAILTLMVSASVCQGAEESWVMYPLKKLSRGIANVAFGALELPMKVYDVTNTQGGIPGITYGPLKGVAYVVARVVVGAVEIVTFPVPLPGCPNEPYDTTYGYGPIMTPEWVVDPEHNAFGFFYNDQAIVSSPF